MEGQWNPLTDWDVLREKHRIIEALRSADLQQWGRSLTTSLRETVETLVRALLLALVPTGLDKKDNLVICWPSNDSIIQCIKVPCQKENYWARILADSDKIATFAYMTPQCLETSHLKCRGLSALGRNAGSLLGTAVCLDISADNGSEGPNDSCLKPSQSYWIGRTDLPLLVKVECPCNDYPRLWASPTRIPEVVLRRILRRTLKLREWHLGGISAELVLIQVGKPETRHGIAPEEVLRLHRLQRN
jgi:hypothetical protein